MGDMGDIYRDWNAEKKARKEKNLAKAEALDDGAWTKHNPWHWSRKVNGMKLDYWPTTNRVRYANLGHNVDAESVYGFIRNREGSGTG